ncbi:hypothetical protein GCM10022287_11870 [Gryllotalpicola koreensis]|uniref:Uncharacterized protein n=1 Tax=Gryllotalpicola koreensis TaxID=993086 RepID=A0ABP7ZWL3_9MICO
MKLVQLGETDAAACVDGVCEIPGTAQQADAELESVDNRG